MSTRANIIIRDDIREEITQVYRHDDGYPSETGTELKRFCKQTLFDKDKILEKMSKSVSKYTKQSHYDVEEPSKSIHPDIEYLYVIDLIKHTLCYYAVKPFQFIPTLENITNNPRIDRVDLIK